MSDEEKFDGLLMNIASQHTNGIQEGRFSLRFLIRKHIFFYGDLLDTLFGFFARKTDLFTSPNMTQKPEELVLQTCRKWEKVAVEKHRKEKAERDEVRRN